MKPYRLIGAIQREGRDLNLELLTLFVFHLVGAGHDARRRSKRGAAGIFKTVAGLQHRLLADHTGAAHIMRLPARIGDAPMTAEQLHRLSAHILDRDMISPDKQLVIRRRMLVQIAGLHRHPDLARRGGIWFGFGHHAGEDDAAAGKKQSIACADFRLSFTPCRTNQACAPSK